MARIAIQFARWLHDDLGANVSLENPDKSYLWLYGAPWFGNTKQYRDVRMSYCRYGKQYQENTRFRVWGKSLGKIGQICTIKHGRLACGAVKHTHLGWDGEDTT